GIFSTRMNVAGAVAGMITGLAFTFIYIVYFKMYAPESNNAEFWWFGISPEGVGVIGAALNFTVAWVVALLTRPPPTEVKKLIEDIRLPIGVGIPRDH
ncbi:MAG: cation acetate symporter, partial [Gammaproteobacteria bacterium]